MAAVDSFQLLYREISRSCSFYYETLALVGALYAAGTAVLLLRDCCTMVRVHFLPRMIPTKRLTQRFGDWAVINGTNATGKKITSPYAEELARNGVCIILVGPDHPALADIASSLMHSYWSGSRCRPEPTSPWTRGKDIGFLVNCVGHPLSTCWSVVNNTIASATLMVRLVLAAGMVERSRGAVVNISASACCRPLPCTMTLTASTVSYAGINRLISGQTTGCQHSCVCVHLCDPNSCLPSRRSTLAHAISTLGVSSRTTGYWPHTLQVNRPTL
uniref:Hydroxysteroid dehydrogenase like 1 n=1 Tax=Takifugu rubripes TaxID=31033 RepID=A0A674P132_TAKRU